MRKSIILFLLVVSVLSIAGQEKMYIHKSDKITLGAPISNVDSLKFNSDGSVAILSVSGSFSEYPVANIDSISFGANSNNVSIVYSGTSVKVVNPYAFEGVIVTINGADVLVQSTTETRDINYILSGSSTNGMFKIYSDKRFNLLLSGVQLTNTDGPAINIQADKKATVTLVDGTVNTLADDAIYAAAPLDNLGVAEDQKAVFFSEGQLLFNGSGSLSITGIGTEQHGLCSDEYIYFESGSITISSAVNDGIHGKDGIYVAGGTVNVSSTGDGIDGNDGVILISGGNVTTVNSVADVSGIVCDSTITVTGGTINVTVNGAQSKGISADYAISLSGGDITIKTTGGVAFTASGSGYDPSYCTAIKGNGDVNMIGSNVAITASGNAAKGVSSDANINIAGGIVKITCSATGATSGVKYTNASGVADSYSQACLSADGNINITAGTLTTSSAGYGGKGITADGTITLGSTTTSPTINITTTGTKFLVSGTDYCHPKTMVSAGAIIINNGTTTLTSTDDGIHSDASITQNGGSLVITTSVEGIESKYITFNGGTTKVTSSNDGLNATMSTQSGGTESDDNSYININGGYVVASCTNGDAVDSNGDITLSSGTLIAHGPPSSPEEAVDFNGTFNVNGGFLIAAGTNSNMNKAMNTTSTQVGIYALTTTVVAANTIFRLQDSGGNDIVTFGPARASYSFLISSPGLKKSTSYSIYTGGSCSGTLANGLYTGGTYTAGTLKKTITLSASSTVNSVTF